LFRILLKYLIWKKGSGKEKQQNPNFGRHNKIEFQGKNINAANAFHGNGILLLSAFPD
jgi:hypothetical protein